MPTLNIDQFNETPSVGDEVKVMGKVKSINDQTGEVDVSYDNVSIVNNSSKSKKKKNPNDNYPPQDMNPADQMPPNSQSLDQALAQSFPNTQ